MGDNDSEHEIYIHLQDSLVKYADQQIANVPYKDLSDYIRALIRRDMEQDNADLKDNIRQGISDIKAGHYHPFDPEKIRRQANADMDSEDE